MKFYKCSICGQIIFKVKDTKIPVICCGKPMQEITPNTEDASNEKHVPEIIIEGNKVTVKIGEVDHPMEEKHYIEWILLSTNKGNQRKELKPGQEPKAVFYIADDEKVEKAYELCNIHGLWIKSL